MPTTAFLVCDFQIPVRALLHDASGFDAAVERAHELLTFARNLKDAVVIHIAAGGGRRHDGTLYSVNPSSPLGNVMEGPALDGGFLPPVEPLPHERVYRRPRVSPFHDTLLNADLRSLGVEGIVLCGVATSGVVLSAFRSAIDADYRVTVVKDACADRDKEVHRVLVEKLFQRPSFGSRCMTLEELRASLRS